MLKRGLRALYFFLLRRLETLIYEEESGSTFFIFFFRVLTFNWRATRIKIGKKYYGK